MVAVVDGPEAGKTRGRGWPLKTWLILGAIMAPVLAGGIFMSLTAERQTSEDSGTAQLASGNAGGPIDVFTGPDHTVYHSAAPLPSDASPRADGKPTLVWFTNTTCGRCEEMKFAHPVASGFRDRLVFVEKATDRDGAADAYGVTATPAFVLIDARGKEVTRFGYVRTAEELGAAIARALGLVR
ncbi:MAG: hypothetical protein C0506_12195 [Anaerolinea sp.]|nr:hypothetical protein [Anaerolinea sp.]